MRERKRRSELHLKTSKSSQPISGRLRKALLKPLQFPLRACETNGDRQNKKKFSQLIKAAQVELMQILSQPEDEKSCEKNRKDKMMIKIPESVHRFDSLCGSPASRQMSKNPFREHLNFLKLSGLT